MQHFSEMIFFSFLGLTQSLPVTSYIKMIDIWMLFTMTVPFLEVIFHTTAQVFNRPKANHVGPEKRLDVVRVKFAEKLEEEEEEEEEEEPETKNQISSTMMRLTRCLMLPISSIIIMFIFWIVGLIVSNSADATQNPNMIECLRIDLN